MTNPANSRGAWHAAEAAKKDLAALNFGTLERAFWVLKRKGFLKIVKEELLIKPATTEAGFRKLKNRVPIYDEKRVWDKKIYLVTYDIPEEDRSDREVLRSQLLKLGCGKLQASVYLTPYNPTEVLREFLEKHWLTGEVLISNLGEDGNIGGGDLKTLLSNVYNLEKLNYRYQQFIDGHKKLDNFSSVLFEFLTILKDDPQIPFALLPENWVGEEAYQIFKKIMNVARRASLK